MNNLTPQFITSCLQKKRGTEAQKEMLPESRVLEMAPPNAKKAAVILLLYPKNNELHTVFMQRPIYNGAHSGQISFPGGMYECEDKNMISTAIRETYEEIGIQLPESSILGSLTPLYISVSQINVFPYVAYVEPCCDFNTSIQEVVHLIETPIKVFLDETTKQSGIINVRGTEMKVPYFSIQEKQIWGATAMILAELIDCIKQ